MSAGSDQDTLFAPPKPGPPPEEKLTERQRLVLELVRTTPGGITAMDVGKEWHRYRRGEHGGRACSCTLPDGDPCAWAEDGGREVLARLRELGFGLVRRKTARWEIPRVTPGANARPPTEDDEDDIPF